MPCLHRTVQLQVILSARQQHIYQAALTVSLTADHHCVHSQVQYLCAQQGAKAGQSAIVALVAASSLVLVCTRVSPAADPLFYKADKTLRHAASKTFHPYGLPRCSCTI